jgi:hypothetical protein
MGLSSLHTSERSANQSVCLNISKAHKKSPAKPGFLTG